MKTEKRIVWKQNLEWNGNASKFKDFIKQIKTNVHKIGNVLFINVDFKTVSLILQCKSDSNVELKEIKEKSKPKKIGTKFVFQLRVISISYQLLDFRWKKYDSISKASF